MALRRYLIGEGTAGADLVPGTGGNTTATLVSIQGAGTIRYQTGRQSRLCAEFINSLGATNSSQCIARWAAATTTQMEGQATFWMRLPNPITTTNPLALITIRHGSGPSMSVAQNNSGTVALNNPTGVAIFQLLTAAQATPGAWFGVQLDWVGGSATTSRVQARIYSDAGTQIGTDFDSGTTVNLTVNAFQSSDTGIVSANNASGNNVRIQDLQLNDGAGSFIPFYTANANVPPEVTTGASVTVNAGSVANVTSTATDSNGTIATRQWTFDAVPPGATNPTLTTPTASNASFTPTVAGLYVLRMTVVDNEGAAGSAVQKVFVPAATVTPILVNHNNGSWSNVGGSSTLATALADASTATYAESPAAGASEANLRVRLAPLFPGTGFSLTLDDLLSTAGTAVAKVRLYEGLTLRKEWTVNPTTGASSGTLTMSSAECATVGTWNELDLEFSWSL